MFKVVKAVKRERIGKTLFSVYASKHGGFSMVTRWNVFHYDTIGEVNSALTYLRNRQAENFSNR